ncbi:MAG TPA: hypothetical protein VKU94_07105 [Geobacterales bacterium]|nr:hypothetical protein [Geobacterales bacterium]
MADEEKKKSEATIIVKGIDQDVKDALKQIADNTGRALSDIVREALKLYVTAREAGVQVVKGVAETVKELSSQKDVITIKNIGELTLEKLDLLSFQNKIAILNVDKLEFADDVDPEIFQQKIDRIVNVKELIVPKSLPKALILTRCSYINKIIQR